MIKKKYKVDTAVDKQHYCHKQIFLLNLYLKKKFVLIIKAKNFVIDAYKTTISLPNIAFASNMVFTKNRQ